MGGFEDVHKVNVRVVKVTRKFKKIYVMDFNGEGKKN